MVNFPIFQSLKVTGYEMYPGEPKGEGLDLHFPSGLSLIIGANGLGKSTLITMIFRVLAGVSEIRGFAARVALGNSLLETGPLDSSRRRMFAQRVADGGRNARATLTITLGKHRVTIERSLHDLKLLSLRVGSQIYTSNLEATYEELMPSLVGVWSFGDWLLMLNTLVFYFETRRQLVWDPSAQVQILRLLFLSAETSENLTKLSREILKLDSYIRNANSVLARREKELSELKHKQKSALDVRAELDSLESLEKADRKHLEILSENLYALESERDAALRQLLNLEQDRDRRYRELERAKLLSIGHALPSASENARYILAQLITNGRCLSCGNVVPKAAVQYLHRIKSRHCVVCDSNISDKDVNVVPMAAKQISEVEGEIEKYDLAMAEARENMRRLSAEITEHEKAEHELRLRSLERGTQIASLEASLPSDAVSERSRFNAIRALRDDLEEQRATLASMREEYRSLLGPITAKLQSHSEAIKSQFERFARDFLLEDIRLDWAPFRSSLGETGPAFDFPAFALDMGSGTFPSPVRRATPDQVSESQREFIDLAFRMALISVAGSQGTGSLVIDAPESSLDAVFVKRAASVLGRFARAKANRLLITSNLVDGDLIPSLIRESTHGATKPIVIDLFELAAPTAATQALSGDYKRARRRLLKAAARRGRG